jgi:SAM-dependent methyltransferase
MHDRSSDPAATERPAGPAPQDFWDQRFASRGFLFGKHPNAYLAAQRQRLRPGMRALAVSDGEGRNGVWLATHGLMVDSFDISSVAIEKTRALATQSGVALNCQQASWQAFAWPERTYDLVVGIFIQFAAPGDREVLFARMRDALRPGGLLIVQGYTPAQLNYRTGGPGQVEQLYTRAWLLQQCSGLDILDLTEDLCVLQEGTAHLGVSAVIGATARTPR